MTRFIIIEDNKGRSREANTIVEAEEYIQELIEELSYEIGSMDEAMELINVYEVSKRWEFEAEVRLVEPIAKPKAKLIAKNPKEKKS